MSYNVKNYTEQGGDITHIGGKLIIEEGGSIEGLPSSANIPLSTASSLDALKDDFNALLLGLKEAGYVKKDDFHIDAGLITTSSEADLLANNGKVESISFEDGVIDVKVPLSELTAFPSSNPSQGTHKWLGLDIKTGLGSIIGLSFDGYELTSDDEAEATSVGCEAGSFVLYIKAEIIASTSRVFTLAKPGYKENKVTIIVTDTSESA